jgi:hypothetical protein
MLVALVLTSASVALAPALHLADTSPFTVTGRHFHARETVLVTLHSGRDVRIRHPRTGAAGRFTVTFRRVRIEPCAGWSVRAIGGRGDAATLNSAHVRCPPRGTRTTR